MMNFITVTNALKNILAANAAGKYRVAGYQKKATSDKEIIENNRLVQVFYKSGDFSGGQNSSSQHDAVFRLVYTVSATAKLDLSVIDDPSATDEQRAAAIAAGLDSEALADSYFNDLISYTWNVLKSATNINLGIDESTLILANQNIKSTYKDEPARDGSLTVLSGYMDYVCRFVENIEGDTPVIPEGDDLINIEFFVNGDDTARSGLIVPNEEE